MCSWFVYTFLSVAWTYLLAFNISFDLYLILHHAGTHSIVQGAACFLFLNHCLLHRHCRFSLMRCMSKFSFLNLWQFRRIVSIFFYRMCLTFFLIPASSSRHTNITYMATISTVKHKNQLYFLSDFIFTSLHEISFSSNFFLAFFFFYCMHALNSWVICPWACWSQFQS